MFFKILSYIRYRFIRQTKYSIHSPFVFDFLTNGLQKPMDNQWLKRLNQYKKTLTDLQKKDKKYNRVDLIKIKDYSSAKAKTLQHIANYFDCSTFLEIETSLGINTFLIKSVFPKATITSLESSESTFLLVNESLNAYNLKSDNVHNLLSLKGISTIFNKESFDIIWINKTKNPHKMMSYFEEIKPFVKNDTLIIFDSIHQSKPMIDVWHQVINDSLISVSIDLYYLGVAFFKKELSKQHFVL